MKRSRFSETQIVSILKEADAESALISEYVNTGTYSTAQNKRISEHRRLLRASIAFGNRARVLLRGICETLSFRFALTLRHLSGQESCPPLILPSLDYPKGLTPAALFGGPGDQF